ncbi:Bos1p NDAI_0C06610 [Naumovozyma dairenensis CBS 421]|uniref:Protein transport protein BOS1 n=1 Tax=Naumovozyma dairenensis (strain ATCC 10597 / BCRC 20456 / CBS 421 / NBRC 0211 / NRRL Y-12639) TaxID=1071378 RepID=G0W959_NAUDC|nr:hypothetical protein NDAI_0C06610 [Naumovozyma dairenensis CBS 421]CCD24320.1 hypothetical protein NDAI_0C06610 [Naumovozyma dairenensis CBS 421]
MNALYTHALKQKNQLQQDLLKFENENLTAPISLQGAISATLVSFEKSIKQYSDFLKNNKNIKKPSSLTSTSIESSSASSSIDKEKALESDLKYQNRLLSLRKDLEDFQSKFKELKQIYSQSSARKQLFSNNNNSTTTNPFDEDPIINKRNVQTSSSPRNSYSNYNNTRNGNGDGSSLPLYNGLQKEQSIFQKGNNQLDLILEMGYQSFEDIVHQNKILEAAQDRMSNSLRTLGVSEQTIHSINRRVFKDKFIFYSALLLLFLSMYLIIKYLR